MRTRGSSGGHHGLEDIQDRLGTDQFARLRVGIGRETGAARAIAGYVLGRFAPGEQAWVERILDRAADQAECWLCEGADKAMSRYNGKVEPPSAG